MVFASTLISTFFSDDFEVRNDIVYKNGELYTGVYQTYYENGNIEFEEEYLNGKAHGHHKNYFQNGNLKNDKLYENNQPNGKSQIFYKTGEIEIEGNYLKGKLNGTLIQFYKNGKKSREKFYKNDKEIKRLQDWDENGKKNIVAKDNELLLKKDLFVDKSGNLFTGIYQKFYENGFLMSQCDIEKGKKHGLWIINDKEGNAEFESEYKNGLKDGLSQTFYKNGGLKLSGKFKKGHANGDFEEYNETGELINVQKYKNGKLIKRKNNNKSVHLFSLELL